MNEAMWEAKQNLEIWGHKILDVLYENKDIYSITFIDKNESIIGLIVAPHDNYNNFLIRADLNSHFDRWDNSAYEEEYDYEHFYWECYNPFNLKDKIMNYYIKK